MGVLKVKAAAKKPEAAEDEPKKTGPDTPQTPRQKKIAEQAKSRYTLAADSTQQQRTREREDLGFYAGDINYQWDPAVVTMREGQNAQNGMPAVPARPCLVINRVRPAVDRVVGQEQQSDLGVQIVPADDFGMETADEAEIELREGLVRRIQRESQARMARTWAFKRAVQAGTGYYAVRTRYVNDASFDQEVYVERIYNQSAVMLDPSHVQPDGSDADWEFIGTWMPWDQYCAAYPDSSLSDVTDDEFSELKDNAPEWFTLDGDQRGVLVVDYFWTDRKVSDIYATMDGQPLDDKPKGGVEGVDYQCRSVAEKQIWHHQLNGNGDILAETEWPCAFMPIVKVTGNELHPYSRERHIEGVVRPSRDGQRGFNYMISKQVESLALSTPAPWMMAEGQAEGYEGWYEAAATRVLPYLYYKQTDLEQRPAGPPIRLQAQTNIDQIAASVNMFAEMVQVTTNVSAAALGDLDPKSVKSNALARTLIEQSQRGTDSFMDNFVMSVAYEGKVENALLKPIYDNRPGRLIQIVTGKGEPQQKILGAPFYAHKNRAIPVNGTPPPNGVQTQTLSLSDHDFNVHVVVAKSYDTRREQQAAELADIIQADPQLMTVFGDLYFAAQDGPDAKVLADRMKLILVPQVQASLNGGQGLPPEAQAAVGQLQGQLQQAGQTIQQLQFEKAAKIPQIQSQERIAQAKNQTDLTKAEIAASATMSVAQAKVDAENFRSYVDALEQRIAKDADLRLHLAKAIVGHQADVTQQAQQQTHDTMALALEHAHDHAMADQQAQHQQSLAVTNAALQPPPNESAQPGAGS